MSPRTSNLLSTWLWVISALFVPWIVLLYLTQPFTGRARDLVAVTIGVPIAVVTSLLATAWLCHRRSVTASITATFAATAAFIMNWFHILTRTGPSPTAAGIAAAASIPVLAVLVWTAYRLTSPGGSRSTPRWVIVLLLLAAVLLTIGATRLGLVTAAEHRAQHLRLVWTGLDVFELIGLVAMAITLRRRSPRVAMAASYTGTLLLCDAWFNVIASTGAAQLSGVLMAFVEVPLAVGSFLIARHSLAAEIGDLRRPVPVTAPATG